MNQQFLYFLLGHPSIHPSIQPSIHIAIGFTVYHILCFPLPSVLFVVYDSIPEKTPKQMEGVVTRAVTMVGSVYIVVSTQSLIIKIMTLNLICTFLSLLTSVLFVVYDSLPVKNPFVMEAVVSKAITMVGVLNIIVSKMREGLERR